MVQYASARPNYLGGTGLINANKSRTVQDDEERENYGGFRPAIDLLALINPVPPR